MLRHTPIHRSLYRPLLFVGCERLPFTLIIAIGGALIMAYQALWMTGIVFIFYTISILLIRRVNEDDPQFFRCLYRYLSLYADYYPANELYPGIIDNPQSYFQ